MEYRITRYCEIKDNKVLVDGDAVFRSEKKIPYRQFIRDAYRHFKTGYPKFFKMDNLSKLGFLSAELLLRDKNIIQKYPAENISVILGNSSSSLESDIQHFDSIKDKDNYFPSPSVFVYTLPNIMSGEIAIRHKILGENIVYIMESFDAGLLYEKAILTLEQSWASCCILGWVEQFGEKYDSLLMIVEGDEGLKDDKKQKDYSIFEPGKIDKLYNGD
jgi:hypothetical protein